MVHRAGEDHGLLMMMVITILKTHGREVNKEVFGLEVLSHEEGELEPDDQAAAFGGVCAELSILLGDIILKACPMPKGARLIFSCKEKAHTFSIQDKPSEALAKRIGTGAATAAIDFVAGHWAEQGWLMPDFNPFDD